MLKTLGSLALTAALSFLPAFAAKGDVWMLEILSLQKGVSPHHVETYIGALDLVARRHGGVRVSRYQASTIEQGQPRLVWLWRFPTPDAMAELMDEFNASLVRLHPFFFYNFVDQVVLAVSKTVYGLDLRGVVRTSLGERDTARCEKVANPVIAWFTIHIKAIVGGNIEGAKCFAPLRRTLLKVLVEHLFPARRVHACSVGNHTVKVEQNGIVPLAGDLTLALGLLHRSCFIFLAHSVVLPVSTVCRQSKRGPFQTLRAGMSR